MPGPTIPLSVTPTGISPQTGSSPSNTLNTSTATGPFALDNAGVYQSGADAVTGKNTNNFNVFRYPHDIGSSEIPHYVIFYINVRKSTLSAMEQKTNISSINFDQSSKNNVPSETQGLAAVAGYSGGSSAAKQAANLLSVGAVAPIAGIAGGVAGVAVTQTDTFKNMVKGETTVLLKDVVALYLNGKPSVQYSASWADVDIGLAGKLGERVGKAMGDMKGIGGDISKLDFSAMGTKASNALSDLFKGSSGVAAALILRSADKSNGALGNFGAALQVDAAVVPNPFKAQLFHTMGFRTFTFDYTFLPQNAQEYAQVQSIIKTFKKYMHPTTGGDKFIMQYPAEFSIAYYYKGATNNELFKMANCVMTTCKVEYGGTDFTTFKRIAGGPTEISMQIAFVETELLTRAHIEAGY